MNRSTRLLVLAAVLTAGLGGCSSSLLESKKIDYKSASRQSAPPSLEVPPDLTAPKRDDRFTVPDVTPRGGVASYNDYARDRTAKPVVASGNEAVLTSVDNMHIERSGSQRWLVVNGSAEILWPDIKDFWTDMGFIISIDQPSLGIMETDWAENRAKIPQDFLRRTVGKVFDSLFSTSERDKFRTRLEGGKDSGTVEIYVSHRGMEEVFADKDRATTKWQPRAADPELEAEMLRRLMVHLGVEEQRATTILATARDAERAQLKAASDGHVNLTLDESFDRSWRRVGLALDRVGFTVEDRDRSQGQYFVRYVDPDLDAQNRQSKGFWSKMAFWRGKDGDAKNGNEYRIQVKGVGSQSEVTVLTSDGAKDSSPIAKRILDLLWEQLR